jgi:hypothetical protein
VLGELRASQGGVYQAHHVLRRDTVQSGTEQPLDYTSHNRAGSVTITILEIIHHPAFY